MLATSVAVFKISCTTVVSICPDPAIKALFKPKNNGEAHDKESNTPTDGPEVTLRLISVGDPLKIHSEVRLKIHGVSIQDNFGQ